jgi:membrane protease YdiL (CAAX protease family)
MAARVRAGTRFAADPLWWLAGAAGLAVAGIFLGALPGALARSALHGWAAWLSCILWQPILEEAVFRGLLQGELLRRGWGRHPWRGVSAANLLSSLAFVAVHFVHHPPLWAASVFAPSLLFGWLRERHRGLGAPIALHVLFNAEFFLAAALALG